jgi:hypothetical protein
VHKRKGPAFDRAFTVGDAKLRPVANTVMVAIVANTVTMMLRFSGAERTSKKGESEEREQCTLHLKNSPIRAIDVNSSLPIIL